MLPQPLFAPVVSTIFRKMSDIYNCRVGAWQRRFLPELFRVVFALRGRVNFTNLARFSRFHEQTFRRNFRKAFQWAWFNLIIFRLRRHPEEPIIGAFDCTFLPKSGTETWGLGRFFSSLAGKPKKGLEVSVLGVVATSSRRASGVDATQTPPNLPRGEDDEYSRVDFYLEQVIDLYATLRAGFGRAIAQAVAQSVEMTACFLVVRRGGINERKQKPDRVFQHNAD